MNVMDIDVMKESTEKIIELLEKHKTCIHAECDKCKSREECAAYACIAAAERLKESLRDYEGETP